MEPADELFRGYEDIMYIHDRSQCWKAWPARVLRTRRLVLDLLHKLSRPFLHRAGFEQVAYMGLFDHD
ncbi:hypothetical protein PIB30_088227 [Stylosanthes scabra]|uniref:Uncharacterized protein n=1 Tax=Stylosanthes scabra TaxID=79078 RepID=A0ABU6TT75_9FABA|nr:hypothetical protein [Stylosanthes scabra]